MSEILVHVGQAGNQIGSLLWQQLAQSRDTKRNYFEPPTNLAHHLGKARGILVDTEPKVVQKVIEQTSYQTKQTEEAKLQEEDDPDVANAPQTVYTFAQKQNAIFTQNGRGNNWALGYSDTYRERNCN